MDDVTTVNFVGDSVMVRIPAAFARYFGLKEKDSKEPKKCKIEDTGKKSALITFE